MALKSGSYIFDLDHVKLSLGIFCFLSCLRESIFHQLSGSTFIFVKNTNQKAAHLMFGLISPVALTPACFLEGQYNRSCCHKMALPATYRVLQLHIGSCSHFFAHTATSLLLKPHLQCRFRSWKGSNLWKLFYIPDHSNSPPRIEHQHLADASNCDLVGVEAVDSIN